jgi:hypothetical protein
MEPATEFLTPPTSFISVSFTTEVRALHRVVPQRQVGFLYCGEILALPKPHREGVALTEEVTMVAIPKIVGVMSSGFLLCLGLSGNAASAADGMKAGQAGERIGGQAGRGFEQVKQEQIAATQAGERIGGQAGRGYEHVNRERVTTHAGERIGGQAGWGYEQAKRERIATQ